MNTELSKDLARSQGTDSYATDDLLTDCERLVPAAPEYWERAEFPYHHVARHHADMEAVYTYEGTDTVQSLIVGRAITGHSAFA